jgi:saccharopine dehydrogenase (NAD+, L-lysine-forming)
MQPQIYTKIFIRNEINPEEHRTPIVPHDVSKLISAGFEVFVESSHTRFFSDNEYSINGAMITNKRWHDSTFNNALIIGLKEISELEKLNNHKHLYFSHSYKQQVGYKNILSAFTNSSSIIYDFEYFIDKHKKRIISFGFYAGITGCVLGILQYLEKTTFGINISSLHYWNTHQEMIKYINTSLLKDAKIAIVGGKGNCGTGVKHILDELKIKYDIFDKHSNKLLLKEYDIVYNCITLLENSSEIWFSKHTEFKKPIIIVDISCDYLKANNPIQLYNENTTWINPVYSYNKFVDIIAINNLPSLLPKDSSVYFSNKCVDLLQEYQQPNVGIWHENKKIYYDNINNMNIDK